MAPTMQRKLSATKLNSLCSKSELVLLIEGAVIKSPPFPKMANESSYKKRWMDLVRIDTQTVTVHDPIISQQQRHPSIGERKTSIDYQHTLEKSSPLRTSSKRRRSANTHQKPLVAEEHQQSIYMIRYWGKWEDKIGGSTPKKIIHLETSFSVSITEHPYFPKKYPHTFALNTASRNFYVHADSEEMLNKWQTHIAEAIHNSNVLYAPICVGDNNRTESPEDGLVKQFESRPENNGKMSVRRGSSRSITSVNSDDSGNVHDIDNGSRPGSISGSSSSGSHSQIRVIPKRPSELQLRRNSSISSQKKSVIEENEEGDTRYPKYEDMSSPTSPLRNTFDENNNEIQTTIPQPIYAILEKEKTSFLHFDDVQIEFPVGTKVVCSSGDSITFVTENVKCVLTKVVHV